eukprot:CAMPEP_0201567370 /NCGR_PEP_ID=MMETSP0190_2-20130828/7859_1 /ASSEMBLY_ACC=CAM_ASM_000263 /TAXON_ID=37353 /ORGANISM="Rosalina sp." /LENGTH=1469 /DNA_ID=CAMNT_0047987285 /DNA_START=114 /DNA_END=4523 /DNA_ORIENTATION=-
MSQPSDDTTNSAEAKEEAAMTETTENAYSIGDYVELQTNKKNTTRKGYIRFKGKIDSFGDCVGVELDEKITDATDGKFNDKEYFKCSQGKGTFIKIAKIIQKLPKPPSKKEEDTNDKSKEESKDDESFPAAPETNDKSEEDQLKKPKKKKKKKKKTDGKKKGTKKGTTANGTGKKGKKGTTSNGTGKKGATSASKRNISSSGSKKKVTSKKKEKKEIDFNIPKTGSNKEKLKFVYSRLTDAKSPFKNRVELMKNAIPIVEDEKSDDATGKYAVEGFKKCFVAQLTDRKKSSHIAACNLLNSIIKSHTKQFKHQIPHYMKYLMQHLEKSDAKSAAAAEASIKVVISQCTVKDNKSLGVIIAELIRFGSSAKNKNVRKHAWMFIHIILKTYEPKKGGKTKKPPKAILDALQTGLKQGLADSDRNTQKEAMHVLHCVAAIDEARSERITARMSPAAKRQLDKLFPQNKPPPVKRPSKIDSRKIKKVRTPKIKTPGSKTPGKGKKGKDKGSKKKTDKGKKATGTGSKTPGKGTGSKTPGSTKLTRNDSKSKKKGGKGKGKGKDKDGKTTKGGTGSKKKGKDGKRSSIKGKDTKGGKKGTKGKDKKGDTKKGTTATTTPTAGAPDKDTNKDDDKKEETKPSTEVDSTADTKPTDRDETSTPKSEEPESNGSYDDAASTTTDATDVSQDTDVISTTTATSESTLSNSTTTEANAEAKDDTQSEQSESNTATEENSSSLAVPGGHAKKVPSLLGDQDPAQIAAALDSDIPSDGEDDSNKTEEPYLLDSNGAVGTTDDGMDDGMDDDSDDDESSDSDSDSESDNDDENDIIGGQSSENDARDLIESFLDLKDPQINWKMIEFLSKDNMTHLLMSYISRMPQGPKIWQENLDVNFDDVIPGTLPLYSAESDEIRATQLSYSLMRILSNEHAAETVKSFLLRKCQEICLHALAVFHPLSKGNVYHGRVVLEILLNHWPKSFMAALANQRHIQSLLKCALFRNLHQGNLNSFFLDLICFRPNQKIGQIQPVKKKLMKMFVDWKFMEYLLSASCDPKHGDDVATKYATFFIDMVARCASIQEAGELFKGHEFLIIDSFMNGLLDKEKSRTIWHRISCGQTLVQFLDISSRPTIMDPASAMAGMLGVVAPDPNPNILHPMFEDSLKRLHTFIPNMCDTICDKNNNLSPIKLASGLVSHPFGQVKLNCLELLTVSADFAQFKCGHVLGLLKLNFWEELLNMAFIHNQNNMYLCHFRRLIHLSMIFRRRFLKHLFVNCQMLERFVDFYENKPHPRTTLHGYILQMLWDIYNHDQREDDDDSSDQDEDKDGDEEEEDDPANRDSVVINSTPRALVDEDEDEDEEDGEDNTDNDNEEQKAMEEDSDDEFSDDVVLKPNFSKEPEDQWDIVSFFNGSDVWKQFIATVSLQMEAQNATETQVPNMNVANNQQQLDQLLQNLLGPANDDASDSDSDSTSSDEDGDEEVR